MDVSLPGHRRPRRDAGLPPVAEADQQGGQALPGQGAEPIYDRDLENYKRLHADGAISVGVIITRGRSLQDSMRNLVKRFLDEHGINELGALKEWGYRPTVRQQTAVTVRMERRNMPFRDAFVDLFVADKFGEATTHWRKLEERVRRGVGNPCPLVLIGLPDNIVVFGGEQETVLDVEAADVVEDVEANAAPDTIVPLSGSDIF